MKIADVTDTSTLFFVSSEGRVKPRGPQIWRWVGTTRPHGFYDLQAFGRFENGELVAAKRYETVSHNPYTPIKVVKHLGAEEMADLADAQNWTPAIT